MGASFSLPASAALPRGARVDVVRGAKYIQSHLEESCLVAEALGESELDRIVCKALGKRPRRVADDEWQRRKQRKCILQLSARGTRRVAAFVCDGRDGRYLASATLDAGPRSRTADVGVHFALADGEARRLILGELLRRLRRTCSVSKVRSDVPVPFADACRDLGFEALRTQDRPREVCRMHRRLDRWSAAGHVLCLAALCRAGRASAAGEAGGEDALSRTIVEAARGEDADGHWALAFLRRAVAYV